jgi:hypothetical protein
VEVGLWKGLYGLRTKALEKTIATVGPFKFQTLTMYETATLSMPGSAALKEDTPPDDSETKIPGRVAVTFPRIESPRTDETEKWNRMVEGHIRSFAGEPERGANTDLDFSITYATRDIISLDLGKLYFEEGMAHPNHGGAGYIVLLRSGRELKAADLFTSTKPWKTFLKDIVFRKLQTQADREDWSFVRDASEIDADNVKRWTITQQGLEIHFVPYEVSDYASGGHSVVVTWAELKPYLKAELPFAVPR